MTSTERLPLDRDALRLRYTERLPALTDSLAVITGRLEQIVVETGVRAQIRARVKSFDSLLAKVQRDPKRYAGPDADPLAGPTDILGVRIVCPFLEDVDTVLTAARRAFQVLEVDFKGDDRPLSEFGYESTHLLVCFAADIETEAVAEVQIRTQLQDAWAEVEHELIYKVAASPIQGSLRRKLAALSASLSLADSIFQEIREYQRGLQRDAHRRQLALFERIAAPVELAPVSTEVSADLRELRTFESTRPKPRRDAYTGLLVDTLTDHAEGRLHEAVEGYTQLLTFELPEHLTAVIRAHRGGAYVLLGAADLALRDFTAAIEHDPGNSRPLVQRGLVHRSRGGLDRALLDFDEAVRRSPLAAEAHHCRALALADLGRTEEALAACETALRLEPDFEPARTLLTSWIG